MTCTCATIAGGRSVSGFHPNRVEVGWRICRRDPNCPEHPASDAVTIAAQGPDDHDIHHVFCGENVRRECPQRRASLWTRIRRWLTGADIPADRMEPVRKGGSNPPPSAFRSPPAPPPRPARPSRPSRC